MTTPTVLLVDDEKAARFGMRRALEKEKYRLLEAENGRAALDLLDAEAPDLLLLDLNMPVLDGFGVLEALRDRDAAPPVIVLTAYGSEKIAVEAMKKGAYDYLAKPYDIEELRLVVRNALERVALEAENRRLRKVLSEKEGYGELVGESEAMRRVFEIIEKVAPLDVTVLIQGESGTGKELCAREMHRRGPRASGPFIALNCAALPDNLIESELFGHEKGAFTGATTRRKGKFELAHKGTLFLDEVGDMSPATQAKLLRVLEARRFERLGGTALLSTDARVICATNRDLAAEVEKGAFRRDLYYRIKVVDLVLPPLRARGGGDIALLAKKFLDGLAAKYRRPPLDLSSKALRALTVYPWPGNVRELKHTLEKSCILAEDDSIGLADLPAEISHPGLARSLPPLEEGLSFQEAKKRVVESFERAFLEKHLSEARGNISQAARMLGLHRQSLQQKLKDLGINPHRFKE
jgi:two-component system response regulator AtoC/two-component system nitrogen regulation response regulator NtrX